MGWDSHPALGILTTTDTNGEKLNLFDNYGQLSESEITMHEEMYGDADIRYMQNNDQLYHCLKN